MRPLKLMLVLDATHGATGRYLEEVARALCQAGVSVHVVCPPNAEPGFRTVTASLRTAGAEVTEVDMWRAFRPAENLQAIRVFRQLLLSSRPDVLHLHGFRAGALGRIAAALTHRCPVVYTPHAHAFLDDSRPAAARLAHPAEGVLGTCTDHLIAVSQSEARQTLLRRMVPAARLSVIPNGLGSLPDEELLHSAARPREAKGSKLRLGYLGPLERQQAPIHLINLAVLLERRGVDFHLEIAGKGSLGPACGRYSKACGLARKVRFRRYPSDPAEFYRSIDVFTLTSRYEGLGYNVLDAMSWGLPVVAFNVPGVNDAVISGATGFLVRPGAIDRLAERVARLAKDPALSARMGLAGRQRVAECFRLDRQVSQLQGVYATLVKKRMRRRPVPTSVDRVARGVPVAEMRVLYVSDCGLVGGAERSLLELMEETRRHGVEPHLMCPPRSALARAAKMRDLGVIGWPLRRPLRPGGIAETARVAEAVAVATVGIPGVLRRGRFDIVHANSRTALLQVGPAARLARTPCVWHWRDFYDRPSVNRVLALTADMSIAVSESVYKFASAQLGPKAPLMLLRSGLKCPDPPGETHEPSRLRSAWGAGRSDILVGVMGQARPRKGIEVFLRAMDEAIAQRGDLRAILLCTQFDGEQQRHWNELNILAQGLRCRDRILFAGPSDDIHAVLRALDIVVVPSLREPVGRVAVEAMLAERPVVASGVDGLAEIVADAKTGLLVPPGNARRLSEAVLRLAADPDLRSRMGLAGRERALRAYSITRTAMELVECYRRVREGAL